MWLSQQISRATGRDEAVCSTGVVTIAGEKSAVMLAGERRELAVAAPAGLRWSPAAGSEVLVLRSDEGEQFIIGLASGDTAAKPGQLMLGGEKAGIRISEDAIEITGNVSIRGRLLLDGVDIGEAIAQLQAAL